MKNKLLIVSIGFALFSMFFGSGNLVFPITVGLESNGHYILAAIGILLTGVIVPFLGVLAMTLYKGEIDQFFACFGKKGIFLFSLFALSLMGPFGVLARCLTVAHGALLLLAPGLPLPVTSLILCTAIYFLAVNKNKIVTLLGTILTPFLLISIAAIFSSALFQKTTPPAIDLGGWDSLKNGFFQGYQTMDLLAAFFFSKFVISHLNSKSSTPAEEKNFLKVFGKSAVIGAGILSLVYAVLVLMGWMYSPVIQGKPPQEMLGIIAQEALGPLAAPCVCVAIVLACLTTAIVLASLFAEFLQKDVTNEKIKNSHALLITLAIGFLISTLDFAGIAKFLGPILEAIYPALIALTIVNALMKLRGLQITHWPFTLTLLAKLFLR